MAPARSTPIITTCVLLSFLAAAFIAATPAAAAASDETTCVPSLQRLLSCLDFIEHRSDEIPTPCCIEVRRTVAEQPCCLMHVVRGNAARLIGPEYDNTRAMVNVTAKCLGDASILMSITRNCSGMPLPPLTPEFTFTTAARADNKSADALGLAIIAARFARATTSATRAKIAALLRNETLRQGVRRLGHAVSAARLSGGKNLQHAQALLAEATGTPARCQAASRPHDRTRRWLTGTSD
ncbi:unnamed protein product [Miscanthus lutarioriparius]|uniref:Bifunctional inhibitor/plant lipid transfer protein/seed storage helical domain-containing protein n=1 Tax=Miscanthus lutarioriparius TaxID=422564 RepID=A0A811NMS2_9POAL|nr:unnamed protein product [Miscanthus lutarioriparius]